MNLAPLIYSFIFLLYYRQHPINKNIISRNNSLISNSTNIINLALIKFYFTLQSRFHVFVDLSSDDIYGK